MRFKQGRISDITKKDLEDLEEVPLLGEVNLTGLRGGKNKEDITNSRKNLAEFLVNSLGSYQRAM